MTDDSAPAPIVANATPELEQVAAGVRQLLIALGAIAGALGYAHVAGDLSVALDILGPAVTIGSVIAGQIKTRQSSQNVATLAAVVPNSVAVVKH